MDHNANQTVLSRHRSDLSPMLIERVPILLADKDSHTTLKNDDISRMRLLSNICLSSNSFYLSGLSLQLLCCLTVESISQTSFRCAILWFVEEREGEALQ